ncbi:HD domain-containing protein [Desulfatirhabdium butyrativorans]|uniref:HD domain-containing protein n=1 Tax=Desulfatirhabdium butyrativorans TaxID=340467 RepID=UPI0003FBE76D
MGNAQTPRFWAKLRNPSDSSDSEASCLSLSAHSLDVAVVFRRLAALPTFRQRLETSASQVFSDRELDRLSVVSMLHDLENPIEGFRPNKIPKLVIRQGTSWKPQHSFSMNPSRRSGLPPG